MKKLLTILTALYVLALSTNAKNPVVRITTTMGSIEVKLYEDTPIHAENFLKLIKDGFYDQQLFHRVINEFMIQTGDPNSKAAGPNTPLGMGGTGYTLPAEFDPNLYHKKGALAAARQSDRVNPKKESSGSQFYIIQGRVFSEEELQAMVRNGQHLPFTKEQIKTYTTIGGSPHLDNAYTVFGEVIKGLEVIDAIAGVQVQPGSNRPIKDVRITSVSIMPY